MKSAIIRFLTFILIITFTIISFGLTKIPVTNIEATVKDATLKAGDTYVIKVIIRPSNATDKKLSWSSANRKIATVDKNGKVKGIIAGKTVITATSLSNKKAIAKINVEVIVKSLWGGNKFRFVGLENNGKRFDYLKDFYGKGSYEKMNLSEKLQYDFYKMLERKYDLKFVDANFPYTGWDDWLKKMRASTMAGDVWAEVWEIEPAFSIAFQQDGMLVPLNKYTSFDPKVWDIETIKDMSYKGNFYSAIFQRNLLVEGQVAGQIPCRDHIILFNRQLIRDAGYNDKELQRLALDGKWTWDKMMEIARKITKDTNGDGQPDVWGFGFNHWTPPILQMLKQNNGGAIKEVNGKFVSQLTKPENLQALQLLYDAAKEKNMKLYSWDVTLVKAGKIGFSLDILPVYYPEIRKSLGDNAGILPMPLMPSSTGYISSSPYLSWCGKAGAGIQATLPEDKRKIAIEIMKEYYTGFDKFVSSTRDDEQKEAAAIAVEKYKIDYCVTEEDNLIDQMIQSKCPVYWDPAVTPVGAEGLLGGAFGKIMRGEKTPKEALQEIEPVYQGMIDKRFGQ